MRDFDALLTSVLRSVQSRPGFAAELHAALVGRPTMHALEHDPHHALARWIVAGAVAGIASVTGAVYRNRKRHRGAA